MRVIWFSSCLAMVSATALAQQPDFTIGGVVWDSLGGVVTNMQKARQATGAMTREVVSARKEFWKCYQKRCKELGKRRKALAAALQQKDAHYAIIAGVEAAVPGDPPVSVDALGGAVDGGIVPQCRSGHAYWARCWYPESMSGGMEHGFRACESRYEPYVECRDQIEYEMRPFAIDSKGDPMEALVSWRVLRQRGYISAKERVKVPDWRATERRVVKSYFRDYGEPTIRKTVKKVQAILSEPFKIDKSRARNVCPRQGEREAEVFPLDCFNEALGNLEKLTETEPTQARGGGQPCAPAMLQRQQSALKKASQASFKSLIRATVVSFLDAIWDLSIHQQRPPGDNTTPAFEWSQVKHLDSDVQILRCDYQSANPRLLRGPRYFWYSAPPAGLRSLGLPPEHPVWKIGKRSCSCPKTEPSAP